MKRRSLFGAGLWAVPVVGLAVPGVWAAALEPVAVGEPAVSGFISGRPNHAATTLGVTTTANTFIPEYFPEYVNDGIIDGSIFPWIPLDGNPDADFIRMELAEPMTLSGIVLQGHFEGRSQGTYTIQATTDAPPIGDLSNWQDLGTYTFSTATVPMPRTGLSLPETSGVTGVQVLTKLDTGLGASIQEIELYGPFDTPPAIVTQPVGGSFAEGAYVVLGVEATAASSFQWKKDGVDIPGATGGELVFGNLSETDAGDYTVVITNPNGSVTSAVATLAVTAAPTFATYREAVLSDNPIRYYPLDDTTGTEVQDLGSLATPGIVNGGVTLGAGSVTEELGSAARFDGAAGTLIDLGNFHPGDSVTIEAWVQMHADAPVGTWHAVVARWEGSYELDFAPGDIGNFVVRNDANAQAVAAAPAASARQQWHHLVGVFDGGVATVYLDGVRGADVNLGGILQNLGPEPDRVMIGATRSGSESSFNFKGLIDEVAIYDHALPAEKIRAHYRAALPEGGPELAIQLKAEISWPSFPAGYVLQVSDSAGGNWENVELDDPAVLSNGMVKVYVPVAEAKRFYRLVEE